MRSADRCVAKTFPCYLQATDPGVIHVSSKGEEVIKESPLRRTFSKHGLEETWDFYQETQGPETLESMPEAERKVCCLFAVPLITSIT